MNSFGTWLADNKLTASLAGLFLLLLAGTGWWTYTSWGDYDAATQAYQDASDNLGKLNKKVPFPNESNKAKFAANLKTEQENLASLLKALQSFKIPVFGDLEQAKPQDRPQLFQDALRTQVTKIKALAASKGSTLPPGFYLGMDEYENRLPSSEEVMQLSKQLSALNWLAENLCSNSGLIIAEFSRVQTTTPAKKDPAKKTPSPSPNDAAGTGSPAYETLGSMRTSFRCDQHSLNELVNSISAAPYFFILEGLQLQNTTSEPPRRDALTAQPLPPSPAPGTDGQAAIQRLPIIVGLEQLNVSMKLRVLEFPVPTEPTSSSQPKASSKK